MVAGVEKSLPVGLALATGQRAQAVEAPGDGRDEPPFATAIGGNGPKQGRAGLVGAVRAAQPLDRRVRAPTGLEEIVNAAALIGRVEAGVVTPPRARSEEHTSELQSLMRISYAVLGLKKKT